MGLLFTIAGLLVVVLLGARRYSHIARLERQVALSWNRVDTLIARRNDCLRALFQDLTSGEAATCALGKALAAQERARLRGDLDPLAEYEMVLQTYVPQPPDARGCPVEASSVSARALRHLRVLNPAILDAVSFYNQSVEKHHRAQSPRLWGLLPSPLGKPGYLPVPSLPLSLANH